MERGLGPNVPPLTGDQAPGLRRFLLGLIASSAAFAATTIAAGVAFDDPGTRLGGIVAGLFAAWLVVPWIDLRRGRLRRAVLALCGGLIVVPVAGGLVLPNLAGTVAIVPLIAVAIGLQYLDRRPMAAVIGLSGAATLAIAIISELAPRTSGTPSWVEAVLRTSALTVAVLLISYLVWQSALRLREALAAVAAINRDLAEARANVGHANRELSLRVGDLERRNREIELLSEMAQLLQGCRTSDEVNGVIQATGRSLFPEGRGGMLLLTPARDALESVARWGPAAGPKTFDPNACWALRRGGMHTTSASRGGLRCAHLAPGATWSLCVPLAGDGEAFGALCLEDSRTQHAGGSWEWERRLLAATVAEQVGLFLANFRLRETLTVQSTRDPLTGLFNRRFMEDSLEREIRRAAREGRPVTVLMLDLDHFKTYNDARGHQAGDALLRALGDYLRANTRADDVACRYGGDEFTIILPNASIENAVRRAEALRAGAREVQQAGPDGPAVPVTISVGLAAFPEHGDSADALLRAADAALFAAKESGRDHVAVAAAAAGA